MGPFRTRFSPILIFQNIFAKIDFAREFSLLAKIRSKPAGLRPANCRSILAKCGAFCCICAANARISTKYWLGGAEPSEGLLARFYNGGRSLQAPAPPHRRRRLRGEAAHFRRKCGLFEEKICRRHYPSEARMPEGHYRAKPVVFVNFF